MIGHLGFLKDHGAIKTQFQIFSPDAPANRVDILRGLA